MPKTSLTPDDWATAALDAIGEGGVASVAVETLAPRVGASKGSFYWHFADRAAVLQAALHLWERTRTEVIIEELEMIEDPIERLRVLFARAFGETELGRLEAAMTGQPANQMVRPVLERVTARRIGFLEETFAEIGFSPAEAHHRALITYTAYLGFFAMVQGYPDGVPREGAGLQGYVEGLLEVLTRS